MNQECDTCNRYPDSTSNGVKLCEHCELIERKFDGDLGLVHDYNEMRGLVDQTRDR